MGKVFLYGMKGGGTPAVLEEKTVALDMAGGDQEVTPSTGYTGLSKAVVTRPATFLAENIKNGVTIGGVQGTFVGTAIANNLDDLVDGTLASFTMPNGKTKVHRYLFYNDTALTYANLQGATQIEDYAFYGCSNAEIVLPSTLTSIGQYAFNNAGKSTALIVLDCPNAACSVGTYAFASAKVKKVSGNFTMIGAYSFSGGGYLEEVDITACTSMQNNVFTSAGSNFKKLHLVITGPIADYAFYQCYYIDDLSITGNVTSLATYVFQSLGYLRSNPDQNVLVLDFSNSTFTSVGQYTFSGTSATNALNYFNITLPSTCTSLGTNAFAYIKNSNIFFKGDAPTIQSNTFTGMANTNLFVPYQKANAYRTKTNWTTVASSVKGYADENTFTTGQTLPIINEEGYGLTWYSDMGMTTQVTTVTDASQKLYCAVGTTILAYRIKSITTMDCTVTISDGTNTYGVNDQVLVGTSLTITSAYTDPTKTQVYMFDINGTDYKPATSETITVASDITVLCLYYDGINAPVDPVLANNSWQQVLIGCQNGLAGTLWQVGDTKTGSAGDVWRIVDLKNSRYARADGTGYTNCGFMLDKTFDDTTTWRTSSNSENYSQSLVNTKLSTNGVFYNQIDPTLAALVDQNKIVVKASQASSSATVDCTVGFFAPCYTEMGYTSTYGNATNAETICNGVTMGAFEYFASNTNSLRIRRDSTNTARAYWLRSRYASTTAVVVNTDGSYNYNYVNGSSRVCPCFAF